MTLNVNHIGQEVDTIYISEVDTIYISGCLPTTYVLVQTIHVFISVISQDPHMAHWNHSRINLKQATISLKLVFVNLT